MYNFRMSKELDRVLNKLLKKNKPLFEQVMHKINEIISSADIEHYKNLRHDMKDLKRVHIGHFVLTFKFDKNQNLILFDDFDHHDNIYQK